MQTSWGLGGGLGETVDSFVNGRRRSLVISDNMSTPYVNAVYGQLPRGSALAIGGRGSKRSAPAPRLDGGGQQLLQQCGGPGEIG
jgi:hypothetical protein